jgi:ankyrin repeat protein
MLRLVVVAVVAMGFVEEAKAGSLFDAAGRGDLAVVEKLVSEGTDVDERGRNAETPLIAAALASAQPVAEFLINHGADVMARNRGGLTPLHAAAYAGSAEIAQLLLDHGAALDANENIGGDTPLFLAAEEDRVLVVELLLARGADPMLIDGNGLNVLAQAWVKKRIEVVRLLKSHGATCPSAEVLGSVDFHRRCVEAGQ